MKKNVAKDSNFERKTAKDDSAYFVLKAANHEIIGSSEAYSSEAAREKGIASVKANGPTTVIKDKTLPVL